MYFIGGSLSRAWWLHPDDDRRLYRSTSVPIVHLPPAMDERRVDGDGLDVTEGADSAATGTAPAPESAPPGARVDDAEHRVPGPTFDGPGRAAKPWSTSLAAESSQAGVANDPADAQDPQYPDGDDEAI
jgi:hypothetical protein